MTLVPAAEMFEHEIMWKASKSAFWKKQKNTVGCKRGRKKKIIGLGNQYNSYNWWQRINTGWIQGARMTGKHSSKPDNLTAKVSQSSGTTNRPDTPTLAESPGYNVLFYAKVATDR